MWIPSDHKDCGCGASGMCGLKKNGDSLAYLLFNKVWWVRKVSTYPTCPLRFVGGYVRKHVRTYILYTSHVADADHNWEPLLPKIHRFIIFGTTEYCRL